MVLRLPEGAGKKARFEAFKGTVTDILEKAEQRGFVFKSEEEEEEE